MARGSKAPLQVRWVFDAVRQFGLEGAMRVAELAVERKDDGVVAFGIGGDEERGPAEWFRDVFAFAKRNGLALRSARGRDRRTGIDLGMPGTRSRPDRSRHPRRRGSRTDAPPAGRDIPLEVCITSNVCTGAVASLDEHPVRRLYDAGVPITINTDDPALFRTSLHNEYAIARDRFGISEPELTANGFRYALDYRPTTFSSASSSLPASDQRP